jgi:hypothetical protein
MRPRTWGTPSGRSKDYFFPRNPFRLVFLALGGGAILVGLLLCADVFGRFLGTPRAPLMPGPLIAKHSTIVSCEGCHAPLKGVVNFRCQRCHDEGGPGRLTQVAHVGRHYTRLLASKDPGASGQVENLQCAVCHVEHRGREAALSALPEGRCVSCHGRTRKDADGPRPVIASFPTHPDFRILATLDKAPPVHETGIYFSHAEHVLDVEKDLKKRRIPIPSRQRVCEECHSLDTRGRQGHQDFREVSFETHCLHCHSGELKVEKAPLQDLVALGGGAPVSCASGEVVCSGGEAVRQTVAHKDPFILHNVRALRRELFPSEHAREYQDLLVRASQLERRLLLSEPLAALPAPALLERVTTYRSELQTLDDRIREKAGASAPADAAARLNEVAKAAKEGGDPSADVLAKALEGASLSAPEFERERDALLALLDAIAASDQGGAETKRRAAYLRLRLLSLQPGESAVDGLQRARRDRQDGVARVEDELGLRRSGIPPTQVPSEVATLQAALAETTSRLRELRDLDLLPEARPEERDRKQRALKALLGEPDTSGCVKCHNVERGTFAPVTASKSVLTLAVFAHEPHLVAAPPPPGLLERLLSRRPAVPAGAEGPSCETCHKGIEQSQKSTELHLETIRSCRECHNSQQQRQDCELCHQYHPPHRL